MKENLCNHRRHHLTRELGTPNKQPKIAVGLGQHGLVPAYTLEEEEIHVTKDEFTGMSPGGVLHGENPEDFHEYPIPDSFIGAWLRRRRK